MKRLFFYVFLAILVIWSIRTMRGRHEPYPRQVTQWPGSSGRDAREAASRRELAAEARHQAEQAVAQARRAMEEAGHEARHAWQEAKAELRQAYADARDEIRQAYHDAVAQGGGRRPTLPPPPAPSVVPPREEADGLPVPIVPGTRVTDAEARPPVASPEVPRTTARLAAQTGPATGPTAACEDGATPCCENTMAAAKAENYRTISGDICANEDRARTDARKALRLAVAEWLDPDVPAPGPIRASRTDGRAIGSISNSWTPPERLLDSLIVQTKIDPYISKTVKEDGPLYIARLTADFSPRHRAELVDAYNRELVQHRLFALGGSLGFVLICLAAVSGYIRADEATKGYYTNRLRLLAAAGVGATGVIVYRLIA